jgi:hypothetical protein
LRIIRNCPGRSAAPGFFYPEGRRHRPLEADEQEAEAAISLSLPEQACSASVSNGRRSKLLFYFNSGSVFFLLFTGRGVMDQRQ